MPKNNIHENDMGDRMMTGLPYNAGGSVSGGSGTFTSPDVSQNPSNFYQSGEHKVDAYINRKADGIGEDDIEKIKYKVTPDEIQTGMDYELKRMFIKNKSEAKRTVVQNLKKDPKYYSNLNMLDVNKEKDTESNLKEMLTKMYNDKKSNCNYCTNELKAALTDTYERKRQKRNGK